MCQGRSRDNLDMVPTWSQEGRDGPKGQSRDVPGTVQRRFTNFLQTAHNEQGRFMKYFLAKLDTVYFLLFPKHWDGMAYYSRRRVEIKVISMIHTDTFY